MRLANKIVLATLNPDKYFEFRAIFQAYPEIELVPAEMLMRNASKLSLVEKYDTYLENSIAKARAANHASHYPSLGDDTGLEVDCLGGRPGVRSHRYAKLPAGSFSKMAQDQANRELLLEEMKKAGGPRAARFKTTLALCIEGILVHSTGVLEGSIADAPRGEHGFGYDSLFIPQGATQTLAEMNTSEKNQLSHRAKAVHELMNEVRARGIAFAKP